MVTTRVWCLTWSSGGLLLGGVAMFVFSLVAETVEEAAVVSSYLV